MRRGAWRAAVCGVAELDTAERLSTAQHKSVSLKLLQKLLLQHPLVPTELGAGPWAPWQADAWNLVLGDRVPTAGWQTDFAFDPSLLPGSC